MATCASCASLMVFSFSARSVSRSCVCSAVSLSLLAICWERSVISIPSLAIRLFFVSSSLVSRSTDVVLSVRTCSFEASSAVHQLWCCASSPWASCRRTIRSWIIRFTLAKGSSRIRAARLWSTPLPRRSARASRKAAALAWLGAEPWEPTCNKAAQGRWRRAAAAAPVEAAIAGLCRISTAFSMAVISSARSFWRSWKSAALPLHCAVISARYLASSARVDVVSLRSDSICAFDCRDLARCCAFVDLVSSALDTEFFRSPTSIS
mmetsp:Transcript_85308/g.238916  ORF Transcript_85308/g.238916 Transcript_85308/m.238916 type:complete len:265 (-) Transcript_85308:652-1446(-)